MSYQTYNPKEKILTQLGAYNFIGVKAGQSTVPTNLQIAGGNYNLSQGDTTSRTLSNNYTASATTDTSGFEFQNGQFLRGSTQEFRKLI